MIEEITEAAHEAIEQAASEAAKAAVLASLERETAALRELQRWRLEAMQLKRDGRKNTVLGVVFGILGGLSVGITGTLLISNYQ